MEEGHPDEGTDKWLAGLRSRKQDLLSSIQVPGLNLPVTHTHTHMHMHTQQFAQHVHFRGRS